MQNTHPTRTLSAQDLLDRFLTLAHREPELSRWNEEVFAKKPDCLARLRQLKALFSAFGIPWDLDEFLLGSFASVQPDRYALLHKELCVEVYALGRLRGHRRHDYDISDLAGCFRVLMTYRITAEDTLGCFDNILCSGGWPGFGLRKADEANTAIRKILSPVDDLLLALISPENRRFTVEELVARHGFPDVDLQELDFEAL